MRWGKAEAHANLGLVKYWGKDDEELILPSSPSISLTIDALTTDTEVYLDDSNERRIIINDRTIDSPRIDEYCRFLMDELKLSETGYRLISKTSFPTETGLSSSSAGYAALAGAFVSTAEKRLTSSELSRLARRGSGSACRSITGGFNIWKCGNDKTSFAEHIDSNLDKSIRVLIIVLSPNKKDTPSREGMRIARTSPLYHSFIAQCQRDAAEMRSAIEKEDLRRVGEIAEQNALAMNRVNATATPKLSYTDRRTDAVYALTSSLRRIYNVCCYCSNDAGCNPFVICDQSSLKLLEEKVGALFPDAQLIEAASGPGLEVYYGR